MTATINISRDLRSVLSMILNALDRDAAEGKAARGEMAAELRALLSTPPADAADMGGQSFSALAEDAVSHTEYRAAHAAGSFSADVPTEVWRCGYAHGAARILAQHRQQAGKLVEALRVLHRRNDHPGRFDAEVDRITSEALADWEKTNA